MPVSCGIPDRLRKGMVTGASVAFPGAAVYGCDTGYTLSNDNPTKVSFSRKCQANGEFEPAPAGLLRPVCTACQIPADGDDIRLEIVTCDEEGADTRDGGVLQLMVGGNWGE